MAVMNQHEMLMQAKSEMEHHIKSEHHFNRYLKFIESRKNRQLSINSYIEVHHILPRSLAPKYKKLKDHPWNAVSLTPREHIIAHIMLYRACGDRMKFALKLLLDLENLHGRINSRHFARLREGLIDARKGHGIFKDKDGNRFIMKSDDPRIAELGLVGNNKGRKLTEEQRAQMRIMAKNKPTVVVLKLYALTNTVTFTRAKGNLHLIDEYLSQGWLPYKVDTALNFEMKKDKVSQALKGRVTAYDKDGNYLGRFYSDDVVWSQPGVKNYQKTKKRAKQLADRTERAKQANMGTKVYNNGTVAIKVKIGDEVPAGFVSGGLPRPSRQGTISKRRVTFTHAQMANALEAHKSIRAAAQSLGISDVTFKNITKREGYVFD